MALKALPGGVIYDDKTGSRLDEPAGRNLEAIHRQLGKRASDALNMAEKALAQSSKVTDGAGQQVDLSIYATRAYADQAAVQAAEEVAGQAELCLLYTSPSPRD